MATNTSFSKRYDDKPYIYWWDVWDQRKDAIDAEGVLILVQKDTKLRASVSADQLLPLLTEVSRTSRGRNKGGNGNWGLCLRSGRPDEIEVEAGGNSPATIQVSWEQPTCSELFTPRLPFDELEHWSSRYDYGGDADIEQTIATKAQDAGCLTKADFLALCRWKTPRSRKHCSKNPKEFVREATRVSLSAKSERLRIGALTLLDGVSWPTASTILHFCHSDPYPILDFRALWSLGIDKPPPLYRFDFWWAYVQFCRALAEECGVTMRVLDRALWQYSKENQ